MNRASVERICEAALECTPSLRAAYVATACGDDQALRREVEALLAHAHTAEQFLEVPALNLLAQGVSDSEAPVINTGAPTGATGPRPFDIGTLVLGRFRIVREVAEGGMGVVYEVVDEKLNETRALKCAKPGFAGHLSPEARNSLRVTHPNVCRVFEIHTTETAHGPIDFLTMEYVDGGTLAAALRERGALPEPEARDIALQICAGVAAAHAQQLLHRDLKPTNVLLTKDAAGRTRAVVTDFGLAQEPAAGSAARPAWSGAAGTPSYLAPERWRGKSATIASDIYALGVLLHEVITGRQPEMTNLREKILAPDLPKRWRTVIARCLDVDPARRYTSAAAVARALVDRAGTIRRLTAWTAAAMVPIVYVAWQLMYPAPIAARLAILPLEAGDGDPQTAALARGASADLTGRLMRRRPRPPQLVVIPVEETSGLETSDPGATKDRLGASHVVRGTVTRRGDLLYVRAAIVDTTTKVAMREWEAQYPSTDAAAVATGLSGLIAATFKLPRQTDAEEVSPAAYAAYAEGSAALRRGASYAEAAIAAFDRAVALDPRSVLPRAGLAEAYYLAWLRSSDEAWLMRGRAALAEAQRLNPDSLAVRLAAGRLNLVPGEYERAAQEYLRATELDPASPEAWRGVARAYQEMAGRDADAVAAFMKSIELQPGYYAPLVDLGGFYFRRGNSAEAEKLWTRAVALAPDVRVVHGNLGALYVGTGRYVDAERELLRALEIEPNAPASLINLGALYQYLRRDEEAARIFERARAIGQETPALLLNLGDSHRRLGMTAAAATAYTRGRELAEGLLLRDPGDANARVFAAYFALRLGDRATAQREVVQALKLGGRNVAVMERAALCYEAMGDRNSALAVLGSATPDALRDLARHPDLEGLRGDPRFVAMTGGPKR